MKKIISIIVIILIIAGLITFYVYNKKSDKEYYIGIGQFGEHPSLDNCRSGFMEGLKEEGIVEGENLKVDYQNANFDGGTTNIIADKFKSENVDLAMGIATPMAQAIYNGMKDSNVPVIFTAVTDPVAAGLVDGNVTGTSDKILANEQLSLIRKVLPDAKKIGVIYTTSEVNSISTLAEVKSIAGNYGFEIVDKGIATSADIPLAADSIVSQVDCLLNFTDNTVVGSLPVLLEKANAAHIPVFGSEIEQVKNGCIATNGIDYYQLGIQTGKMAAKVLKGEAKASDISYETISQSSIYINSSVFSSLGISIPDDLKNSEDVANK